MDSLFQCKLNQRRFPPLKTFLLILFFAGSLWNGLSQGQIVFNNRITNSLIAPIYSLESNNPHASKTGNNASGIPSGTQQYTGTPLSGNEYTAQLFGGPTNAEIQQLAALYPATVFRAENSAGYVLAPAQAITVHGVPEGSPAKIVLRAWRNVGGVTNWQQVLADPTVPRGESNPFISAPLGGIFIAPPNLNGLRSFNLFLPEPAVEEFRLLSGVPGTNGSFVLRLIGPTNRTYSVHSSVDLTNWTILETNLFLPTSLGTYEDFTASSAEYRYYRLRQP